MTIKKSEWQEFKLKHEHLNLNYKNTVHYVYNQLQHIVNKINKIKAIHELKK